MAQMEPSGAVKAGPGTAHWGQGWPIWGHRGSQLHVSGTKLLHRQPRWRKPRERAGRVREAAARKSSWAVRGHYKKRPGQQSCGPGQYRAKNLVPKVRVELTRAHTHRFLSPTLVVLTCHAPSQTIPFRS